MKTAPNDTSSLYLQSKSIKFNSMLLKLKRRMNFYSFIIATKLTTTRTNLYIVIYCTVSCKPIFL